jgi:23S rRNA (uracil1939-C5)-methyltransferase
LGERLARGKIGPFSFIISPASFFQVNSLQTNVLYEKVLEYAALSGKEEVIDAYCGIGTISLFLAQQAGKVTGIEIAPAAVYDARKNAARNEINNVEFV